MVDSAQLTAKNQVGTPANWQNGEDVVILPTVNDEMAKELFPAGWTSPKPYLRLIKDPNSN